MAVVVRLRRMGTTNKPFFRVVAADERTSNNGRFLENLGWYAPRQKGVNYELNMDRIEYWKGVGARTTETVDSLIKKARRAEREPAEGKKKTSVKKVADLPVETEPAPVAAEEAQPPAEEEIATETEAVAEENVPDAATPAEEPADEAAEDDSRKTAAQEEKEES